jgi:hypothetical protein
VTKRLHRAGAGRDYAPYVVKDGTVNQERGTGDGGCRGVGSLLCIRDSDVISSVYTTVQ